MARALRIEYPGAIYHVMNRGDRREPIFREERDYALFLKTFGEACAKTDWQVQAYCLMKNHFHLVVETPNANLVAGMKWFLSTYTARFNRRHKFFGHLFSGRYKALIVDGTGNGYLKTVKARRLLNEELDKLGWAATELACRAKGDARKIRIARRLRAETAVTLKWLAAELPMGTWTQVSNLLAKPPEPVNQTELKGVGSLLCTLRPPVLNHEGVGPHC